MSSSLALSVMLSSSSSEPSTLSKALALAPGDLGDVGRIRCPALEDVFPDEEEVNSPDHWSN